MVLDAGINRRHMGVGLTHPTSLGKLNAAVLTSRIQPGSDVIGCG